MDIVKKWKVAFIVTACLLIVISGYFVYLTLDNAVTITYMQEGYRTTEEDLAVLMRISPDLKKVSSKKDLLYVLRKHYPDALIAETDNSLSIGQLEFLFSDKGELIEIRRK